MSIDVMSLDFESARSPEDAAQIFLNSASRGLAEVFAKAVSDALAEAGARTKSTTSIAGWEDLIKSAHVDLCWEREFTLPPKTVVAWAPYENGAARAMGVSIGISITGTF